MILTWLAGAATTFPSPGETLTNAITLEGLLLTAFAFAVRLAEPASGGRSPFFAQARFGWLFVLAITAVGVSAGAAWWEAYCPEEIDGVTEHLRAGGLAIGIVAPPIFATIINWQARAQ